MNWLDLIKALAPIIIAAKVPHGSVIAPLVVNGISEAEAIKGSSGSEKLNHAVNLVNVGIDSYNAISPKPLDKDAINKTIGDGISTTVDVANLIHKSPTSVTN